MPLCTRKVMIASYVVLLILIAATLSAVIYLLVMSSTKKKNELTVMNNKMNFTEAQRNCEIVKTKIKFPKSQADEDDLMNAFAESYQKKKNKLQDSNCGAKFFVGFRRLLYQEWTDKQGNLITFIPSLMSEKFSVYRDDELDMCSAIELATPRRHEVRRELNEKPDFQLEIINNMKCQGPEWKCFLCHYSAKGKRVYKIEKRTEITNYEEALQFCKKKSDHAGILAYVPHKLILEIIYPQIHDHILGCHKIGIGNRVTEQLETINEDVLPYKSDRLPKDMLIKRRSGYHCVVANVNRNYGWEFENCSSKHCFMCTY